MTWRPPVVTEEPAAEPISLEEAKAQLAIDGDDSDALLEIYVKAARRHIEDYAGIKLVEQTCLLRASCFADLERPPTAPIAEVTEVKYLDSAGVEQTLSADVYEAVLIGLEPEVRLQVGQSWPTVRAVSDAVRVTAVCGYGPTGADVPEPVRQAMLLIVGDWYRNREDTVAGGMNAMPHGARSLLENYRRF